MGKIDKEAVRRFVIKHPTYQIRKTHVVVRLVEKRFVTLSPRTIRHWVNVLRRVTGTLGISLVVQELSIRNLLQSWRNG